MSFTDLLEDYLDAKADYDEAKKSDNAEWHYFAFNVVERYNTAKDRLNSFVETGGLHV